MTADLSLPQRPSVLLDSGTTYSKIRIVGPSPDRLAGLGPDLVIRSRDFRAARNDYNVLAATGHNAGIYVPQPINELVALAGGALALVREDNFVVLDIGSRDLKFVRFEGRRPVKMDWNTECGAFAGSTVEMLLRAFDLSPDQIPVQTDSIPVTCGVLGMTALFDLISQEDVTPADGIGRFQKGLARNCQAFCGRPKRLYLSGGFCENRAFINSFDCEVIPLGRFVIIEGIQAELSRF